MIVVQLSGGLANQLFQYAAAKSMALDRNVDLLLDVSLLGRKNFTELETPRNFELNNFLGIKDRIANEFDLSIFKKSLQKNKFVYKYLTPIQRKNIYKEKYFHYNKDICNLGKDILLSGNWQSEKYFSRNIPYFKNSLTLKPELYKNVLGKAYELKNTKSVSVHIRRADYLRLKIILEWHGVLEKTYYQNCFNKMNSIIGSDYEVYYFSDDPNWVIENLLDIKNGEIISNTISKTAYEDFYLMSQCRHNIIANSSFSWWAAWLNDNPEKTVIAPKKWFDKGPKDTQDIIPNSWLKV